MKAADAAGATRLTVAPIREADIAELARLHGRSFPEDVFTMAGQRVVRVLFREFASEPSVVVWSGGRIIGYCVGAMDKSRFLRRLARRHPLTFGAGAARAAAQHPGQSYRYLRGLRGGIMSTTPEGTATGMYMTVTRAQREKAIPPLYFLRICASWMAYVEARGATAIALHTDDPRIAHGYELLGAKLLEEVERDGGVTRFLLCHLPTPRGRRWILPEVKEALSTRTAAPTS